jgi:hypothetical protein
MRRLRRPLPLPRRHYIALLRSKKNVAASGSRLRLPGLVHRGKSPHGASQQAVLGQWPPPRPARSSTQPPVKDQLNDNPLRPGRGLGVPHPQGMRQPTPAPPGTSVPCLHAPCLLQMSTDGQDRPPPPRRRDRAADRQDAGKPLCGRVQRRGERARSERHVRAATPARAQALVWSWQPHVMAGTGGVAYLVAADNVSGPLASRLSSINQPVLRTRNAFSTLLPSLLADI